VSEKSDLVRIGLYRWAYNFASGYNIKPITKFSIARFFLQSVDNKQYTNSIRDLNIIAILFKLGLDLTIGLIHVIAQQT